MLKENIGSDAKVVWLTGLPGSGKTTIAFELKNCLSKKGIPAVVLDGDELRKGLNRNLGFDEKDRLENIRRTACVADVLRRQGIWTIAALITPQESMRQLASDIIGKHFFVLVYIKASLETCIARDPKGLYKKALQGTIVNFTGISAPFDPPSAPDLILDTDAYDLQKCLAQLNGFLFGRLPG